jgi:hypothetical protein
MEREQLFALRRQAREEKRQRDLERLEVHRQIVDLLFQGDELSRQIRSEALGAIDLWEKGQICNPRYITDWRQWLNMPEKYARAAILREDDLGVSMRQNSPFDHVLGRLMAQRK